MRKNRARALSLGVRSLRDARILLRAGRFTQGGIFYLIREEEN